MGPNDRNALKTHILYIMRGRLFTDKMALMIRSHQSSGNISQQKPSTSIIYTWPSPSVAFTWPGIFHHSPGSSVCAWFFIFAHRGDDFTILTGRAHSRLESLGKRAEANVSDVLLTCWANNFHHQQFSSAPLVPAAKLTMHSISIRQEKGSLLPRVFQVQIHNDEEQTAHCCQIWICIHPLLHLPSGSVSWFNSSPCRLQLYESHLFSNLQSFSVTLLECLHACLTSRRIRHVDCTARQREAERETASKIYLTHRTLNRWAPDSSIQEPYVSDY